MEKPLGEMSMCDEYGGCLPSMYGLPYQDFELGSTFRTGKQQIYTSVEALWKIVNKLPISNTVY